MDFPSGIRCQGVADIQIGVVSFYIVAAISVRSATFSPCDWEGWPVRELGR